MWFGTLHTYVSVYVAYMVWFETHLERTCDGVCVAKAHSLGHTHSWLIVMYYMSNVVSKGMVWDVSNVD